MFVGEKHVVVGHANYKECSVCGDMLGTVSVCKPSRSDTLRLACDRM